MEEKQAGNEKFKAGDYHGALEKYISSLSKADSAEVHCNMSLVYMKIGNRGNAKDSAHRAIEANSAFAKGYVRLFDAVENRDEKTSALASGLSLVQEIDFDKFGFMLEHLGFASPPVIIEGSRRLGDNLNAINQSTVFVVRNSSITNEVKPRASFMIVGRGGFSISNNMMVVKTFACLYGATLTGGEQRCPNVGILNGNAHIEKCTFTNLSHAAILATGGSRVYAKDCILENVPAMGVEVREGSSASIVQCRFEGCNQGVTAYNAFRRLDVSGSTFQGCKSEGILASTALLPQSKRAFAELNDMARKAKVDATMAAAFTFDDGQNEKFDGCYSTVVLRNSLIQDCWIGLSLENGINASVSVCEFLGNGKQHAVANVSAGSLQSSLHLRGSIVSIGVSVKGGTNAVFSTCRFKDNGVSAVEIGTNYNGDVNFVNCAFSNHSKQAIVQMGDLPLPLSKSFSTPAALVSTLHDDVPMEVLKDRLLEQTHRKLQHDDDHTVIGGRLASRVFVRASTGVDFAFYPIGNTPSEAPCPATTVLLAGCGDWRNVLAWANRRSKIHVIMNDIDTTIITRNLVLIAACVGLQNPKIVLSLWANTFLSVVEYDGLQQALATALKWLENAPSWLSIPEKDIPAVRTMLHRWAGCETRNIDCAHMKRVRDAHASRAVPWELLGIVDKVLDSLPTGVRDKRTVEEYYKTGNMHYDERVHTKPNVTFLRGSAMQYQVYFSTCIYRAVAFPGDINMPLNEAVASVVIPQMESLRDLIAGNSINVSVSIDDALQCIAQQAPDTVDWVDLSNLSDYMSVAGLLVGVRHCLSQTASVRMLSMLWRRFSSPAEYFENHFFGTKIEVACELFGMDLIQRVVPGTKIIEMTWRPCGLGLTNARAFLECVLMSKSLADVSVADRAGCTMATSRIFERLVPTEYLPNFRESATAAPIRYQVGDNHYKLAWTLEYDTTALLKERSPLCILITKGMLSKLLKKAPDFKHILTNVHWDMANNTIEALVTSSFLPDCLGMHATLVTLGDQELAVVASVKIVKGLLQDVSASYATTPPIATPLKFPAGHCLATKLGKRFYSVDFSMDSTTSSEFSAVVERDEIVLKRKGAEVVWHGRVPCPFIRTSLVELKSSKIGVLSVIVTVEHTL